MVRGARAQPTRQAKVTSRLRAGTTMLLARILTPRGGIGERSASGSGLRQSLPSLSTATDGHGQESRKTLPGQGQQSQVTPGRAKILLHSPPPQLGKRQLNPVRPRSQGTRGASPLTTLQWEGMGGGASREPTRANPPLPPSGQAPLKDGEETEGGGGAKGIRPPKRTRQSGLGRRGKGRA